MLMNVTVMPKEMFVVFTYLCVLMLTVYARVLPVWIVPFPLLAVRPELKPINLISPSFIISKIIILFNTR